MTGYLSEFTPHRESPDEIAWEMTILVDDQDWQRQPSRIISDNISPSVLASKCYAELQTGLGILPKAAKKVQMNNDFLDAVDTLISSINTFSASFIHAANSIDSFETAVAGDIGRLRAGVHQLRTSVLTLRDTMARAKDDSLFIARTADTDINWFTIQLDTETSLLKAMSLMEELDKQAETAQRKSEFVPYTAKLGDSWESISNDFYGGPQGAAKIRSANGVKYGDLPHPGHSYVIPI